MADPLSRKRVERLRESRKAAGEVETTVWIPSIVKKAIDQHVASGAFPSRRAAINHALERVFVNAEK
jgi:hypothetical protein